ncbi:MAG: DUF4097 domain-containing protein [bacterium]
MRKRIFIYSIFILVGLATLLFAGTIREHLDETFKLQRGSKVVLSNTNGNVIIESWNRDEVRIRAEKIVRANDRRTAEKIMDEIEIEIDSKMDFLRIDTYIPRRQNGFWGAIFGENAQVRVEYRLLVPEKVDLEIGTVNGRVSIAEVTGEIEVHSTNGRIEIAKARGSVQAKTTNGGIEVELLNFDQGEDMTFKTTNGSIRVYLPAAFSAFVDARTTNGSIRTDFPIKVRGEISRRRLRGSINRGGGHLSLHTTNGSIKILER